MPRWTMGHFVLASLSMVGEQLSTQGFGELLLKRLFIFGFTVDFMVALLW